MPTTPRLALPYPALANAANVPADLLALATPLDAAALWAEGSAAARPATGAVPKGYVYRATDTGVISLNTSAGWVDIGGAAGVPRGTSLPASPSDGQEFSWLVDSSAGVEWRMKYRAAGGYWDFVGGPPLWSEVTTSATTTGSSFGDLTTPSSPGPSIVVPKAGDYDWDVGFTGYSNIAGTWAAMSVAVGAAAALAADEAKAGNDINPPGGRSVSRPRRKTGLTAVTLAAKYRVSGGGATGTFENRWMKLWPVRVTA